MFRVSGGDGSQVVLEDVGAGSRAQVAPWRGALVTSLFARGREWLYLDRATFDDPAQNVRGGIPVLFPSPGKLANDRYVHAGHGGHMKQHGFARNRAWRELARSIHGAARVQLELVDDAETRALFPWSFRTTLGFALAGHALRLEIAVENTGREVLPFGYGFHPYFAVPQAEKGATRIPTAARRAWDNVRKQETDLAQIALGDGEVDLHLIDHGASAARLETSAGTVSVRGAPEFGRWVIWTLPGKDFVCLEPWTAPGNALNTGASLIELAPGARRELWVEVEVG